MRFSYNWLKEFLPLDLSPDDLAKELLLLGFEVSDIRTLGPGFEGVVVGKVLSVQKHPNADRLSLCQVSDGSQTLSIVCGAPNVVAEATVAVAKIGAVLPGGFKIERAKIRGVESQGMICSAAELGVSQERNGILILPTGTPIGQDAAKLFPETDRALDIEITPNRPDCLSHLGLARELSIRFMKDLRFSVPPATPAAAGTPKREVRIEAKDACSRYVGREFTELRVGASPGWMVKRLEAVGLRPVNALVDVTNYVLFELGHPMHAFDSDKLKGTISIRFSKEGETLRALDHKDYALSASELVIADASGVVAVAGVIGGEPTSVTEKTTRAFLESACFKAGLVRRSAKRLKIRTDSSYRFERGTDPESAALAAARAAQLISQVCGKPSAGEAADAYPERQNPKPIEVSIPRINRLLGTDYPESKIEAILHKIDPGSRPGSLTPPHFRLDLKALPDLAEEVARHMGYDKVPDVPKASMVQPSSPDPMREEAQGLRRKLTAHGFSEAFNYDFVSKAQLALCGFPPEGTPAPEVLNPLSDDWAFLRPTLLIGLLQSAAYNLNRGAQNLRLFEFGRVYAKTPSGIEETACVAGILVGDWPLKPHWRDKPRPVDFYDVKGVVESLLGGPAQPATTLDGAFFHPKASVRGAYGMLHPNLLKAWDIQKSAGAFSLKVSVHPKVSGKAHVPSAFPSSSRDISIVLDDAKPFHAVAEAILGLENMSPAELIDVYAGKGIPSGKKSFTLRLTFSRSDRTLKDEEVDASVAKALAALKRDCGAELRS